MEKKRSKGITIIASIYRALSIFITLIIIGFLFLYKIPSDPFKQTSLVFGFIMLITFYAVGTGLLKLEKWALNLSIIVSYICVIVYFYGFRKELSSPDAAGLIITFLLLAFFVASIFYLTRPKVKEQFK